MGDITFISPEFSLSIQKYLSTKEQSFSGSLDFPVIVIRTLIFLYGELDIINPYITKNESNLGGFDNNLTKYGFSMKKLQDFKKQFSLGVRSLSQGNVNSFAFLKVEQYLIDMFFLKKKNMNLKNSDVEEFKSYICLTSNPILADYRQLFFKDSAQLDYYFSSKLFESNHTYRLSAVKRQTLFADAYLLLGYSVNQVAKMSDEELEEVNKQVYRFFKIPMNEANRNDLLIQAVNYYKRFGNRLTSGNGYVDLLLLSSVICTAIFIVLLIAIRIF